MRLFIFCAHHSISTQKRNFLVELLQWKFYTQKNNNGKKMAKKPRVSAGVRYRPRIAYIDAVDFIHELGEAIGGTQLYTSPEEVLKHENCAFECGVYKVSVHFEEVSVPSIPYEKRDYSPYDDSLPAMCGRLILSYEKRVASFQAEIERLRAKIRTFEES
jgi:hypothetical protein